MTLNRGNNLISEQRGAAPEHYGRDIPFVENSVAGTIGTVTRTRPVRRQRGYCSDQRVASDTPLQYPGESDGTDILVYQ